jgi:phage baseplate assembly protein V
VIAAARSRSADQRYYGVVEAIVADVNDPQKLGRVKVTFPWFDDQMVTEWCRCANTYAGKDYGSFWIPEKDDEVLVAFVHGDMRLPIVLAGLYNGKDTPPSFRDDSKDQKLFYTKAGNKLLMDDSTGDQRIQLTTVAGHDVTMTDRDQKVVVKTKGGHEAILDDAAKTVTLRTSTGEQVVLNGTAGTVTVTGKTVVTLETSLVKNGGTAASQSLMLAEIFLGLFNSHFHMLGQIPTTPPTVPVIPPTACSQVCKTTA